MAAPYGYNFAKNYTNALATPQVLPMPPNNPAVRGGRMAFVIYATAFPTTAVLQYLPGPGTIPIAIATVAANSVTILDLPAGQYQVTLTGGPATGLYADLVAVPQS